MKYWLNNLYRIKFTAPSPYLAENNKCMWTSNREEGKAMKQKKIKMNEKNNAHAQGGCEGDADGGWVRRK